MSKTSYGCLNAPLEPHPPLPPAHRIGLGHQHRQHCNECNFIYLQMCKCFIHWTRRHWNLPMQRHEGSICEHRLTRKIGVSDLL
ncbi:hypothetical protein GDO81_019439 [Engystomops pustulosus]|uniref:Uncharacterized protein n=1 Tax=Engystomops pustulosus TaxID=76066 RepID=A0AAV6YZB4_ENGPU|nr:hypothetical protein GDO81_019439 [Engystomops pustulosus]